MSASIANVRQVLAHVVAELPRGPVQQAIHILDERIAQVTAALDGSSDDSARSAILGRLMADREALTGVQQGFSMAADAIEQYAGRL